MFDVGWTELMLIGIVALIVIGPKDLPEMFRQLGRITAKLRAMSREFQRAMEQAANEAGVKDVANDLKSMTSTKGMGLDAMKNAATKFEKWDPLKNAARPTKPPLTPPPMPATPAPVAAAAPTIHGPATQAQIDKQAAQSAILKETAAKLKAVTEAPPESAAKPAAAAPTEPTAAPKTPKPRAPRKPSKKADTA